MSYESEDPCYKCILTGLGKIIQTLACLTAACGKGPIKEIPQGKIGLKTKFGKYIQKIGPG